MSDVPSWCRLGAKVVCIDAGGLYRRDKLTGKDLGPIPPGYPVPTADAIYTITSVLSYGVEPTVTLREVAEGFHGTRISWEVWRFRPLVPPKTEAEDVALFKQHLSAPQSTTTRELV